jgi:anti-anti-sigma regulatory factor
MVMREADPATVDDLQLGDHVCWTVRDDEQCVELAARSITAGLREGHRVTFLAESLLPAALLAALAARGVATADSLGSGQLQVSVARDTFLPAGRFDPVATIELLAGQITEARDEGWAGLRLVGDMGWAMGTVPGVEHLEWYEAQVNPLCVAGGALAICVYDRRLFSGDELRSAASAHTASTTVAAGAEWEQLLRIRRIFDPPGLRLIGEADLSNRRALASVLTTLIDQPADRDRPLVIDIGELRFADGAAASLMVRAAAASPTGMRIIGCSPALARLLDLVGAGAVAQLTVSGHGSH